MESDKITLRSVLPAGAGLMPFHNTPYRKQLEIHSWLASTAGVLWQAGWGGEGTGQAWRAFFSHWLKWVHQDPDYPTDLFKSLSEPTLFFFFLLKGNPGSFPRQWNYLISYLTCHGIWKGQDSKIPCISRSGLNNPLLQVAILCIIGNSVAPTRCPEQSPQSWQYKMSLDVVNVP